jgi:hypothetical protein
MVLSALLVAASLLAVGASSASAAGDANQASCPNEAMSGFEPFLADCRAYELVSPAFKDGNQAARFEVSAAGSSAVEQNKGVFAGAESGYRRATYLLNRGAAGWEVAAIGPPAARFPAQEFIAEAPDLSATLWAMREPNQSIFAEDLYLRDKSGSIVKVGPMVPPAAATGGPAGDYQPFGYNAQVQPMGASSDLQHVFFQILGGGPLWPGDETLTGNGSTNLSLYEYSGTGQSSPKLVGVGNDGHLISRCQTSLGSARNNDTYNAVSQTGRTVFFTAESGCEAGPEVAELYARLDGVETVPISEPTVNQCSFCQTIAKAPAQFAGASQDGSKALFLTSQELVPGITGESLFEYDFNEPGARKLLTVSAGSPTPEVLGVARFSQDGSSVYFVARAALTDEPRGGVNGPCRAELDPTELEEEIAHESGRCLPHLGAPNLYLFRRDPAHPQGRVSFVATLAEEDEEDWLGFDVRPVQATPDGDFLVFPSNAGITPDFPGGLQQVYEYDSLSGELVRVSRGEPGSAIAEASADSNASHSLVLQFAGVGSANPGAKVTTGRVLSNDGKTVVFTSTGALTAGAAVASEGGAQSVFEFHHTGRLQESTVSLISDGVSLSNASLAGVTGSGDDIFFETGAVLVPEDSDTQRDAYDAHVNGGFPVVPAAPECVAEQCRQSTSGSPPSNIPASTEGSAEGNSAPTRAERLANALRACKRFKSKPRRQACRAKAQRHWGATRGRNS